VKVEILDIRRQKVAEMDVDDRILKEPGKAHLVYDAVRRELAGRRKGTAATKQRSLVSGGGKKPWKQKGTGRARAGHSRSPVWRGGGKVFGPQPRSYAFSLNRKVRRAALRSVLAAKFQENKMLVLDSLKLDEVKTKKLQAAMKELGVRNALVVIDRPDEYLEKSARNIPWLQIARVEGLNVHDILRHEHLIFFRASWEKVERNLQP
jgi:large subunit ribosomal protein L4